MRSLLLLDEVAEAGEELESTAVGERGDKGRVDLLILIEEVVHLLDGLGGSIGEVGAVEDMVGLGELAQELELERRGRQGSVKVEGAGVLHEMLGDLDGSEVGVLSVVGRKVRHHGSGAESEVWESAATVREDDLDIGMVADSARCDEIAGCAGSLVGIVDHWLGQISVDQLLVGRGGRVDEDDCAAGIEKIPGSSEGWVAEVVVARAISGVENDAIRLESVQGVDDLSMGCLGIEERRDSSEETEALRILLADIGGILIGLSAEFLLLVANGQDLTARGSDGQEGEGDLLVVVKGKIALGRPVGDAPAGRITAILLDDCLRREMLADCQKGRKEIAVERLGSLTLCVERGNHVVVDIDTLSHDCGFFDDGGNSEERASEDGSGTHFDRWEVGE